MNEADEAIGAMEKMEAHKKALLHRAFSVFIFNSRGEMLLQQRSPNKYHSGGLWTNACCSHPAPGEETQNAAARRLKEELGFSTELKGAFSFMYRTDFENGLTENEFDHVFTGVYDGRVVPDLNEVMDYTYVSMDQLEESLRTSPHKYTSWFAIALPQVKKWLNESKTKW